MGKIHQELKKLWQKQWMVEIEATILKIKMNVKKQSTNNQSGIIRKRTTRQSFLYSEFLNSLRNEGDIQENSSWLSFWDFVVVDKNNKNQFTE